MDITIPKVIARADLGEYASELAGKHLCMWVNPPIALLRQHDAMTAAGKEKNEENAKIFDWYANVLSQDEDRETHWTADELEKVRAEDPEFFLWVLRTYWDARNAHRLRKKKN